MTNALPKKWLQGGRANLGLEFEGRQSTGGKQEQEAAGHMAFLTRRHWKLGQAMSPQGDPLPPQGSTALQSSAISWPPGVQRCKIMGGISHSSYHTSHKKTRKPGSTYVCVWLTDSSISRVGGIIQSLFHLYALLYFLRVSEQKKNTFFLCLKYLGLGEQLKPLYKVPESSFLLSQHPVAFLPIVGFPSVLVPGFPGSSSLFLPQLFYAPVGLSVHCSKSLFRWACVVWPSPRFSSARDHYRQLL